MVDKISGSYNFYSNQQVNRNNEEKPQHSLKEDVLFTKMVNLGISEEASESICSSFHLNSYM